MSLQITRPLNFMLILCVSLSGCSTTKRSMMDTDASGTAPSQDQDLMFAADQGLDMQLADDEGLGSDGRLLPDTSLETDSGRQPEVDLGKSYKRGIAFGFESARDFDVISPGVSWWYNWSPRYNQIVANLYVDYQMDWVPMTWNGNNPDEIRAFLQVHPNVKYLLTYNEPNFSDQANMTPAYAASIWPVFEEIAEEFQVKLVGPAVNFCGGCVMVDGEPIANDYIVWLDLFFEEFRIQFGREPKMDFTALHWYDFGLQDQVERIVSRYQKPVWVTEFALWRGEDWNTDEFERNWLLEVVAFLEQHPMVYRYSWFTGRRPDFPKINLFGADGELTPLGRAYVEAPY
ncbi:MAG: hypothetical protein CMH52_12440 [Myxococcales bacterium]|nr:hypothetical protein [Myxococcales bacterium]